MDLDSGFSSICRIIISQIIQLNSPQFENNKNALYITKKVFAFIDQSKANSYKGIFTSTRLLAGSKKSSFQQTNKKTSAILRCSTSHWYTQQFWIEVFVPLMFRNARAKLFLFRYLNITTRLIFRKLFQQSWFYGKKRDRKRKMPCVSETNEYKRANIYSPVDNVYLWKMTQ